MNELVDVHGKPVGSTFEWPEGLGGGLLLGTLELDETALVELGASPGPMTLELYGGLRPVSSPPNARGKAEYIVRDLPKGGSPRTHHLAQRKRTSVFYVSDDDPCTDEAVDMLRKAEMPCAGRRPRWKAGEASWPVSSGRPALFLGQVYVPETRSSRDRFVWDDAVFVFASHTGGVLRFQLYSQDMTAQTAEEHYRLEAMIAEFEARPTDMDALRRSIEAGDRHFYEFLLEHPKLDDTALGLLAQHANTKGVRDRAAKALRGRASGR